MGSNGFRWPEELWIEAKALIESGKTIKQTAEALGIPRDTLRNKLKWDRMSPEARARRTKQNNERRNKLRQRVRKYDQSKSPPRIQFERPPAPPPAALIAERDYRLSLAPRDLTAALQGDPPPGYSALEARV